MGHEGFSELGEKEEKKSAREKLRVGVGEEKKTERLKGEKMA